MLIDETLTHCPQCDADLRPYMDVGDGLDFCLKCNLPLVVIANKYRLLGILGKGGFGTVYHAKHLLMSMDPERVVKITKPEVIDMPGMKERFLREVQLTSALSQRNEHIVRVFDDFGKADPFGYFYVMEYLKGAPLSDYLEFPDHLPPVSWCLEIFEQLCDAMGAAHEAGIIHRDLKPENILLTERRKNPFFLKVLDFGIAKPLGHADIEAKHLTQGILGSPFYLAPEQALNKQVDHRTDIYAMGVILYEMLTGGFPNVSFEEMQTITVYDLISRKVNSKTVPNVSEQRLERQIPKAFDAILARALALHPTERFSSVEEMWRELEPFVLSLKRVETGHVRPMKPSAMLLHKQSEQGEETNIEPPSPRAVPSGKLSPLPSSEAFAHTRGYVEPLVKQPERPKPSPGLPMAPTMYVTHDDEEEQAGMSKDTFLVVGLVSVMIVLIVLVLIVSISKFGTHKPAPLDLSLSSDASVEIEPKRTPPTRTKIAPSPRRTEDTKGAIKPPVRSKKWRPRPVVRKRRSVVKRRSILVRRRAKKARCGRGLTYLRISPSTRGVTLMVTRGKRRTIRLSRGFCVYARAGMVNIERKGYETCFFNVKRQRKIRVKLVPVGQ